jgi:ATP-dependent Clp protease ATP-binding subunit ClpA
MSGEWRKLDPDIPSEEALKLLTFLRENVIGQDHALRRIINAADVFKAGIRAKDKPMYSALLLGPTGVGKTLVAEVLAEYFFGSRLAFTKIECEKFSESHRISDLIGSPAGYVGYWNPGDRQYSGTEPLLSQKKIDRHAFLQDKNAQNIRKQIDELEKKFRLVQEKLRSPNISKGERAGLIQEGNGILSHLGFLDDQLDRMYVEGVYQSIILFDEIEKAHPALHNMLLNIVDKATLTLSNGMVTRFHNSIILMTSNVGSRDIADLLSNNQLGFRTSGRSVAEMDTTIYKHANKALRKVFLPEFINRFDAYSIFRPLTKETVGKILEVELRRLQNDLLETFPIVLSVDDEVKAFIVEEATDHLEDGARLLNKKITKYIREPISRLKNRKEIKARDEMRLSLSREEGKPKIVAWVRSSSD